MTLDELLAEVKIISLAELNPAFASADARTSPPGRNSIRNAIAGALVRTGTWLDSSAVERLAIVRRT